MTVIDAVFFPCDQGLSAINMATHYGYWAVLTGICLKLLSTFAFTLMNGFIRLESAEVPTGELVFFRSILAMLVLVGWLYSRGQFPQAIFTARPFGHLLRGLIGSGGMFFSFAALALLPLPDATALAFVAPLMGVAMAAVLLGEKVHAYRWAAVACGFGGVLVMLHDQLGLTQAPDRLHRFGIGFALLAAICAAAAYTQTRRLTKTEKTGAIVFYFSLLTTLMGGASFIFPFVMPDRGAVGHFMAAQVWVWPGWGGMLVLCCIGILGGIAQICMTESYRLADASVVAAFDYTSMLWASFIGYFAFGDVPSASILWGAAIVAASGMFVIWREHVHGQLRLSL
jgi:drug/metabolite transporter (DMT)-like permease